MVVDPYEDEIIEVVDDGIDGVNVVDGFIDQYSIAGYTMDGNYDATHNGRERKRVGSTTRWVWTFVEEYELMHTSKELVLKGHKCDNGFRSCYLTILENNLGAKFPGTYLKEELHINSKIHVWKRQYVCLKSILGISGVGCTISTCGI
ncbi:hypothetical protein ACS0TY_020823 [Phlomoides rotata]